MKKGWKLPSLLLPTVRFLLQKCFLILKYFPAGLDFPAHLLSVSLSDLESKLTSRVMSVGSTERVNKTLNVEQADGTRDALAKAIYYRLFEFLVKVSLYYQLFLSVPSIYNISEDQ